MGTAVKPISYGPGFETLLTCLDQFPLPQSETSRVEQSGSRHELHAGAKRRKVVKDEQMRGKDQRLCPGIRELARAPAWSWFETFLGPGLIKAVEPLEIAGRTDIEEGLGAWE